MDGCSKSVVGWPEAVASPRRAHRKRLGRLVVRFALRVWGGVGGLCWWHA